MLLVNGEFFVMSKRARFYKRLRTRVGLYVLKDILRAEAAAYTSGYFDAMRGVPNEAWERYMRNINGGLDREHSGNASPALISQRSSKD